MTKLENILSYVDNLDPNLIIWDFDGTIAHSEPLQEKVWKKILLEKGVVPPPDFFDNFLAKSREMIVEYMNESLFPITQEEGIELFRIKNDYYMNFFLDLKPNYFVNPVLEITLKKKIPHIIISNGYYDGINNYLENYNLSSFFSDVRTSANVPNFKKKMEIINYANKFSNTLLIEDSLDYINLVRPFHAKTMGVLHTHNNKPPFLLRETDVNFLIKNI